jgi:hypothetical protein
MPQPNPGETTATGASAGGTTTVETPAHAPRPVEVSRSEKNSLIMRLVAEHGSESNALLHVAGRVIRYQKRAQEAERQAVELRKAIPVDGSVVLTGEEAKAILKLREAKVDLAKLPDTVKEATDLRTRVTAQERKDALTEAAGAKYNAVRLAKVLGDIPVEFKDGPVTKEDGTKDIGRIAYVKKPDGTLVPLAGPIPAGTVLSFGGTKQAQLTAAAKTGDVSLTVAAIPVALVDADVSTYQGTGKRLIPSGTVLGRTIAERDAGTGFGPAADADDEVYLNFFQIDDADSISDVELYRGRGVVYENFLPVFSTLSATIKAKLRAFYTCSIGQV